MACETLVSAPSRSCTADRHDLEGKVAGQPVAARTTARPDRGATGASCRRRSRPLPTGRRLRQAAHDDEATTPHGAGPADGRRRPARGAEADRRSRGGARIGAGDRSRDGRIVLLRLRTWACGEVATPSARARSSSVAVSPLDMNTLTEGPWPASGCCSRDAAPDLGQIDDQLVAFDPCPQSGSANSLRFARMPPAPCPTASDEQAGATRSLRAIGSPRQAQADAFRGLERASAIRKVPPVGDVISSSLPNATTSTVQSSASRSSSSAISGCGPMPSMASIQAVMRRPGRTRDGRASVRPGPPRCGPPDARPVAQLEPASGCSAAAAPKISGGIGSPSGPNTIRTPSWITARTRPRSSAPASVGEPAASSDLHPPLARLGVVRPPAATTGRGRAIRWPWRVP